MDFELLSVPSNLLLNKLGKPSLYLSANMMIWGVISGATAASQTYGGLLACRFILGLIEAAYYVSEHSFMAEFMRLD
jgi:MFS family permease